MMSFNNYYYYFFFVAIRPHVLCLLFSNYNKYMTIIVAHVRNIIWIQIIFFLVSRFSAATVARFFSKIYFILTWTNKVHALVAILFLLFILCYLSELYLIYVYLRKINESSLSSWIREYLFICRVCLNLQQQQQHKTRHF